MKGYLAAAEFIALGLIFLGLTVMRGQTRKNSRILFFLLCFSMAWFIFSAGFSTSGRTKEQVVLWYKLSSLGFAPFFALNLHFYINLLQGPRILRREFLLYLPVPFILGATFFSRSLFSEFFLEGSLWRFQPAYSSPWFWLYVIYYFPYTAATVPLLFIRAARSRLKRHRKQAVALTWVIFLTLLIGSTTDFILPGLGFDVFPPLGPLTVAFYTVGLWFVFIRLDFIGPGPRMVADIIINNIQEMIFVLDHHFNLDQVNRFAISLLHLLQPQGRPFAALTFTPEETEKQLRDFRNSDKEWDHMGLVYKTETGSLYGESYLAKLRDSFGEISGFMIISRENRGRLDFVRTYGITPRELQIVDLCLAGKSSIQMARSLGISDRTVEAHLSHIFNKTGTNCRMELFSLTARYGIIAKSQDNT